MSTNELPDCTPRPIRVNVSETGSPFTAVHVAPQTIDGAAFASVVAASAENKPAGIPEADMRATQTGIDFPDAANVGEA